MWSEYGSNGVQLPSINVGEAYQVPFFGLTNEASKTWHLGSFAAAVFETYMNKPWRVKPCSGRMMTVDVLRQLCSTSPEPPRNSHRSCYSLLSSESTRC